MKALLIGQAPGWDFGYSYVSEGDYQAVVIGSLTLGQLLQFSNEQVLAALAQGMTVLLYTEGLPKAPHNRGLNAAICAKCRELKSWGVVFTDGGRKKLITAQEAKRMAMAGERPGPGAVLTPLAKEILEGSQ